MTYFKNGRSSYKEKREIKKMEAKENVKNKENEERN